MKRTLPPQPSPEIPIESAEIGRTSDRDFQYAA